MFPELESANQVRVLPGGVPEMESNKQVYSLTWTCPGAGVHQAGLGSDMEVSRSWSPPSRSRVLHGGVPELESTKHVRVLYGGFPELESSKQFRVLLGVSPEVEPTNQA